MGGKKGIRYILLALGIVVFLVGIFCLGKKIKQRWIVHVTLNSPHWQERVEEMGHLDVPKGRTVFFGNSLTELFDLPFYFKDSSLINCGIVGDFSEGLLKRTDLVTKLKPGKLFIEMGINDIIEQIPLKEICGNYEKIIDRVKSESSDTKIFIQSNLPVIINRPSMFTDNEDVNTLIKEQNKNLKQLAAAKGCVYIDVYSSFMKEKDLSSLFIWDGIHFTPAGYATWAAVVRPYLQSDR